MTAVAEPRLGQPADFFALAMQPAIVTSPDLHANPMTESDIRQRLTCRPLVGIPMRCWSTDCRISHFPGESPFRRLRLTAQNRSQTPDMRTKRSLGPNPRLRRDAYASPPSFHLQNVLFMER